LSEKKEEIKKRKSHGIQDQTKKEYNKITKQIRRKARECKEDWLR